jgi:hypothetical protein
MGLGPRRTAGARYEKNRQSGSRPDTRGLATRVVAALRDLAGLWRRRDVPPSTRRRRVAVARPSQVGPLQFIGVVPRDITEEQSR